MFSICNGFFIRSFFMVLFLTTPLLSYGMDLIGSREILKDYKDMADGISSSDSLYSNPKTKELSREGTNLREKICETTFQNLTDKKRLTGFLGLDYENNKLRKFSSTSDFNSSEKTESLIHILDVALKSSLRFSNNEKMENIASSKDLFLRYCRAEFDDHYGVPAQNLGDLFNLSVEKKSSIFQKDGQSVDEGNKGCTDGKGCIYSKRSGLSPCEIFNCTPVGKIGDSEINEIGALFVLADPNLNFDNPPENPRKCEKCFNKVFRKRGRKNKDLRKESDSFNKEMDKHKQGVLDQLIANKAGREVLEFSRALEKIYDLGALYGEGGSDSSQPFCTNEFSQAIQKLSNNGCGNGQIGAALVQKRIKNTLRFLNLPPKALYSPLTIIPSLLKKIDADNGKSCNRETFMRNVNNQLYMADNQDYKNVFKKLVNFGIKRVCSKEGMESGTNSVIDEILRQQKLEYSKQIRQELQKPAYSNMNLQEAKNELCSNMKSQMFKVLDCSPKNSENKLLSTLATREEEAFKQNKEILGDRNKLTNLLTDMYGQKIEQILKIPAKFETAYSVILSDKKKACEVFNNKFKKEAQDLIGDKGADKGNQSAKQASFVDFVLADIIDGDRSLLDESANELKKSSCQNLVSSFSEEICVDSLPAKSFDGEAQQIYSALDFKKALELYKAEQGNINPLESITLNNLKCEMNSNIKYMGNMYSEVDSTLGEVSIDASNFEQQITKEIQGKLGELARGEVGLDQEGFLKSCDETIAQQVASSSVSPIQVPTQRPASFTQTGQGIGRIQTRGIEFSSFGKPIAPVNIPEVKIKASRFSDAPSSETVSSNEPVKVSPSDSSNSNSRAPSSVSTTSVDTGVNELNQTSPVTTSNYYNNSYQDSNFSNTRKCDGDCYEEVAKSRTELSPSQISEKIGVKDHEQMPFDIQSIVDQITKAQSSEDIEEVKRELQNQRKKSDEQMKRIEELTKALNDKDLKVIDSKGQDRSNIVRNPSSNPNVVYDPFKENYSSRTNYEATKSFYAPDFKNSPSAKNISFPKYTEERRENSNKLNSAQLKSYNYDIDQGFLRSHSNKPVDDNYVKEYVAYVGKNKGSIDHLVVYKNGEPSMIKVPDPKNPKKFILKPIDDDLKKEIMVKARTDEFKSFVMFAELFLGQSAEEVISSQKDQHKALINYESLVNYMEEAKAK